MGCQTCVFRLKELDSPLGITFPTDSYFSRWLKPPSSNLHIFSCKKKRGRSTSHGHFSNQSIPPFHWRQVCHRFSARPLGPPKKNKSNAKAVGNVFNMRDVYFCVFSSTVSQPIVRYGEVVCFGLVFFVAMCGDSPWWQSPSQASAFFSGTNEVPEGFWSWTQQQLGSWVSILKWSRSLMTWMIWGTPTLGNHHIRLYHDDYE